MRRVAVLLPYPFDDPFDYAVPAGLTLAAGDYVRVPFGKKERYGVVWGAGDGSVAAAKIKSVIRKVAHIPPMTETMRGFIDWVAAYTLSPRGMVLKMAMSVPDALDEPAARTHFRLSNAVEPSSSARKQIAALLADGYARTAADIARETGVSVSTVRGFAEAGGLQPVEITTQMALPHFRLPDPAPTLSAAQRSAASVLGDALGNGFSVSVIDGVTGSGKTEVYFDTIARLLDIRSQDSGIRIQEKAGRNPESRILNPQTLVLLPEIALSVQWLQRFAARFGAEPLVWHSAVPMAKKREIWRAVADGSAQLVVGARSALFLPFRRLSLIVVDECHEQSYKQEDGVLYQARDMAVVRAQREAIPIALVSATPSLETVVNAEQGKYGLVHLPMRHGVAELPEVEIVDMRIHRPSADRWLSEPLSAQVAEALADGHQAMLFINRRGYAPLILCRKCGHRYSCPNCTAWLVEHRYPHRLQCHHCDFRMPFPAECAECHSPAAETLVACGPGVERLAQEAAEAFPDAKIAQMTSDAIGSPEQAERLIEAVEERRINLLIGTQMMAKGHHFPGLAVVGVIDADLGLAGGDLRAGERTWQLLHQIAGRAGRAEVKGRVLLQTYQPDHPVMQALARHDRDGFLELEKHERERAGMPPYGRLAALIFEGANEAEVQAAARTMLRAAPDYRDVQIFGPAPAPLAMLRNQYRYRVLVKAGRSVNLSRLMRDWRDGVSLPNAVRLKIDIDPYSFL